MPKVFTNTTNLNTRLLGRMLAVIVILMQVVLPYHAFLTVWGSRLIGHYTLLRLWKEVLLAILTIGSAVVLVRRPTLFHSLVRKRVVLLISAYVFIQLLWGLVAYAAKSVTLKALGYSWIVNLRFFLFFVDILVLVSVLPGLKTRWPKFILLPAVGVVIFGLLQFFVLPYDILKHFGYGSSTIFPYEDINSNIHFIRIFSTLRGSNPFGAYLILITTLLLTWRSAYRLPKYLFVLASGICLFLTYSRGAWLGFAASLVVLGWFYFPRHRLRRIVPVLAAGVCIFAVSAAILLHSSTATQNILLHTQVHSAVKTTSDQGHVSALRNGFHDAIHEPFGRGPGSAGPASVYNGQHPVRIAENYYIQVAQETGWIGLTLFILILLDIARLLVRQHNEDLAVGLLAALTGIGIVGLFSHVWADDTLSYLWWGLAGFVLSPAILKTKPELNDGQKKKSNQTIANKRALA